MIKISVEKVAEIVNGKLYIENDENEILGVSTDSRTVEECNLYIPLVGKKFDGHDFLDAVKDKGVKTLIWSRDEIPSGINVIKVKDTLKALHDLAKYYIAHINPKVIAVTGSNGKTSIKDILYNVLKRKYNVSATKGNFNNEIGLPLTILGMCENSEVAVLEMGMESFGEISLLSHIANPDIAIISNIGTAHIKELGSRENIAKAKLEILDGLKQNGLLIVDYNEPLLKNQYSNTQYFNKNIISNFTQNKTGIAFDYNGIHYKSNLLGKHQVDNILACLIALKKLNVSDEDILEGLRNPEMTKMRNDFYTFKDVFILDDSYKSNPESAIAALTTLSYFDERKVAVLGDMLDLGQNEIEYHRNIGKCLDQFNLSQVYFYGPLSKYSHENSSVNSKYFDDKVELAKALALEKDCVILFKASRGIKMEEVIENMKEMKK